MGVRDQLPEELRLDRCVRGKVLRHSCVHLQIVRSSELNQFYVTVTLEELLL